jgi:hypothetical protein
MWKPHDPNTIIDPVYANNNGGNASCGGCQGSSGHNAGCNG